MHKSSAEGVKLWIEATRVLSVTTYALILYQSLTARGAKVSGPACLPALAWIRYLELCVVYCLVNLWGFVERLWGAMARPVNGHSISLSNMASEKSRGGHNRKAKWASRMYPLDELGTRTYATRVSWCLAMESFGSREAKCLSGKVGSVVIVFEVSDKKIGCQNNSKKNLQW